MDIQYLINEAREAMLTDGRVMPMIYLELSEGVQMLALDVLSDAQSIPAQGGILARLGWETCKKYPGQQPVSIGMYAEGWRVRGRDDLDIQEKMRPVTSQQKQEVISVSFWQANGEPHNQSATLVIERDHKKRVIDVQPEPPVQNRITMQLEAFRQGCLDAQKPDEEVFGNLDRAIERRMAALSPEERQELQALLQREGLA